MDGRKLIEIWSDIHCPWALIAVHRLRQAREHLAAEITFTPRAWPLEWVNERGTPRDVVTAETAVLAGQEPDLFNAYTNESWPSTFLPAFELVAAARRCHGLAVAEDVDYALRLAFFRDSVDVSIAAGLRRALGIAAGLNGGIDVEAVMRTWLDSPVRGDVAADFRHSRRLPIQGSPQIFWPDGSTTHNPGMTDHYWRGGLMRIKSADPGAPERLLRTFVE